MLDPGSRETLTINPGGVTRKLRRRYRRNRKCKPNDITEHHRRPKSRGGDRKNGNISLVPHYKHEAYHLLFDSFAMPEMCQRFQFYYDMFGANEPKTKQQLERIQAWIHGQRERDQAGRIKRQWAWNSLFTQLSLDAILAELNNIWIDPVYKMVIHLEIPGQIKFAAEKIAATRR